MRFLHTSDWHVGKAIRGRSRADEHRAVLGEIVEIARREAVDLIVVAGDLYETAAPSPEAETIVYQTLLQMAEIAPVVVVAGNHDNARRLNAVSPLLKLGRVTMLSEARNPEDGGVIKLTTDEGTPVNVALLPFISQRAIVRADHLMSGEGFENAQVYTDRLMKLVAHLCAGFTGDAVNLLVAHAFVTGGAAGGGERAAHLASEYGVGSVAFPASASYVALGHLHRAQVIRGATAIHYCGSPLQLDFGEEAQTKQVNLVDVAPGVPAKVTPVPLTSGRALRTLRGTVSDLVAEADFVGNAWLRVRVNEPARAGLADEIRDALGDGVVDVIVDHDENRQAPKSKRRDGRTPQQLFADFLNDRDINDPRIKEAFDQLYEDARAPSGDPA